MVEEGPGLVRELIAWGANFDLEKGGHEYDLARGGRPFGTPDFALQRFDGLRNQRTLLEKAKEFPNLIIREHVFALDLLTQHHLGHMVIRVTPGIECYGCYAFDQKTGEIETIPGALHGRRYGRRGAGLQSHD